MSAKLFVFFFKISDNEYRVRTTFIFLRRIWKNNLILSKKIVENGKKENKDS